MCGCLLHAPISGNLARNPGMCPDWELNRQPFGLQVSGQSTESHQPGLEILVYGGADEDRGQTQVEQVVEGVFKGIAVLCCWAAGFQSWWDSCGWYIVFFRKVAPAFWPSTWTQSFFFFFPLAFYFEKIPIYSKTRYLKIMHWRVIYCGQCCFICYHP